jgi:hypothetical protein
VSCSFENKNNFVDVREFALLWGGKEFTVNNDDWALEFQKDCSFSIIGDAGLFLNSLSNER